MKPVLLLALLTTLHAEEILLFPNGAPGSEGKTATEVVKKSESGEITITQVHQPTLTPYLPTKDKATGAAVIVAPGGGPEPKKAHRAPKRVHRSLP